MTTDLEARWRASEEYARAKFILDAALMFGGIGRWGYEGAQYALDAAREKWMAEHGRKRGDARPDDRPPHG